MMTIALARVGRIKRCGTMRSEADPIHRVAGQAMLATSAATAARRIPAAAQLMARMRDELGSPARVRKSLRQMADRLAAQGVARLNAKRVQRPEIRLGDAKQRAPAEPADEDDREQHEPRAESVEFQHSGKNVPDPCRRDKRREPQDRRRQHDRRHPREQEFRQADFGEQAAGDRQKRLLLRARNVVLGVSVARVEDRPPAIRLASFEPETERSREKRRALAWRQATGISGLLKPHSMPGSGAVAKPCNPRDTIPSSIHLTFKQRVHNRTIRRMHPCFASLSYLSPRRRD